ncbi:asparagine synthase-related protein [Vibrio sp. NH-7]
MFGIASSQFKKRDFQAMESRFHEMYSCGKVKVESFVSSEFAHGTSLEQRRKMSHSSSDRTSVWVDGEAYNLAELKDIFPFIDEQSFAFSLVKAIEVGCLESLLERVDGYFCAVLYDHELKRVKLISDRYGMRMLYLCHAGSKFVWSTSISDLLAVGDVSKELDVDSLACFKELGYILEDRTLFKSIKLISPATVITFDIESNTTKVSRYWSWSNISKRSIGFEDAVEQLGELFLSAVKRRYSANEKIGVAVSGGLDSRAIVAALSRLYPSEICVGYTFGITGCDDIKFASQVLDKAQWHHETYIFTQDNWLESRLPYIDVTSGLLDMQHMHGCEFLPNISQRIDVNLNGYAGDAILGGGFLGKIPWDTRANLQNVRSFFGRFSYMVDVDNEFYNIDSVEPVLYMNRVRRFTAMGSVCGLNYLEQRKPFFDNQLVEFVFSLPDAFRANNRIYSEMLKRFFPDFFLEIPWQKTGKVVGLLHPKPLYMKVYHRIIRLLFGPGFTRKQGKEFTDYPNWLRSDSSREFFTKLASKDTSVLWREFADETLGVQLKEHLADEKVDNSSIILRLATLEIFLSKVLDTK